MFQYLTKIYTLYENAFSFSLTQVDVSTFAKTLLQKSSDKKEALSNMKRLLKSSFFFDHSKQNNILSKPENVQIK